jgi:hypothetical protein
MAGMNPTWSLTQHDLEYLVETLMPMALDVEDAAARLRSDEMLLEAMLDDEDLFDRLLGDEDVLVRVSPWLFFAVLLRRARRDMEQETYTVERRAGQKVHLFDADQVLDLLDQDSLRDYLVSMLASFTRIHQVTIPVRVRQGLWRRYRTNDLDVDSMMRYCQAVDEEHRFSVYRRIGDACLFMSSMFPEHIESRYRYAASRQVRPGSRGRIVASLEEYEAQGRTFYRLAAEHKTARAEGLEEVLATLSEHFVLAEKPLTFVANRYLLFTRHSLFDV